VLAQISQINKNKTPILPNFLNTNKQCNFCQTLKTTKLRKTEKCGLNNFNQPIDYNCTTTNNEKNEEKQLGSTGNICLH
jgi:hypothetical protein